MKIAFIDHHLDNFHANTFINILRDRTLIPYEVEVGGWELQGAAKEWCTQHDVRPLKSIDDAVRWADSVMVLAPDNLECHLNLAEQVLPAAIPTFFDKMLAIEVEDAERIADLATRCSVPVFSSSALSFAKELALAAELRANGPIHDVLTCGMGSWRGYGIHTLSLALALMGANPQRLIDTGTEGARTLTMDYRDGRRAVVDVRTCANEYELAPWRFIARADSRAVATVVTDYSGFYIRLIQHVVEFFRVGVAPFTLNDSLMAVKILKGANDSLAQGGTWIPLQ